MYDELCLGHTRLVTTPGQPDLLARSAPSPSFPAEVLLRWADLHRDMIKKWSASPLVGELLEFSASLHRIEETIKQELE
jgi:hypothetical protein